MCAEQVIKSLMLLFLQKYGNYSKLSLYHKLHFSIRRVLRLHHSKME